jgi:hypothetical protein
LFQRFRLEMETVKYQQKLLYDSHVDHKSVHFHSGQDVCDHHENGGCQSFQIRIDEEDVGQLGKIVPPDDQDRVEDCIKSVKVALVGFTPSWPQPHTSQHEDIDLDGRNPIESCHLDWI